MKWKVKTQSTWYLLIFFRGPLEFSNFSTNLERSNSFLQGVSIDRVSPSWLRVELNFNLSIAVKHFLPNILKTSILTWQLSLIFTKCHRETSCFDSLSGKIEMKMKTMRIKKSERSRKKIDLSLYYFHFYRLYYFPWLSYFIVHSEAKIHFTTQPSRLGTIQNNSVQDPNRLVDQFRIGVSNRSNGYDKVIRRFSSRIEFYPWMVAYGSIGRN